MLLIGAGILILIIRLVVQPFRPSHPSLGGFADYDK
jgi:hypothetical protein